MFPGELQQRIAQGSFLFGLAMGFGAGCGDIDPTSSPPVMAESAATRVNIEITRDDGTPFVVLDKQPVADHFAPATVEQRRSTLPGPGSTMAPQTAFGDVADCVSPTSVSAAMRLTFLYGDDPDPITGMFRLTDVTTLEQIRLQSCIVRQVLDENDVELRDPSVDGETMTVDLVITRRSGDAELRIEAINATVLFGAAGRFEAGSLRRSLLPDVDELVLPLTFDVNRCDPHAVADTARQYGLEVYVSRDGSDAQRIDVDVEPILGRLDEILAACSDRTGE